VDRQGDESGAGLRGTARVLKTIVYFDGGCPVCARGAAHWRRRDWARRVGWVDLMDEPEALALEGVGFSTAMETLHVRDSAGRLIAGGDAFLALWDQLPGWRILSRAIRSAGLRQSFDRAYRRYSRGRFEKRCNDGHCPVHGARRAI
jgi:predicted DCC family thiol-disulfide oxidoreductase YuxK